MYIAAGQSLQPNMANTSSVSISISASFRTAFFPSKYCFLTVMGWRIYWVDKLTHENHMVVVRLHAQGVYHMLTVSMETAFLITVVSYSTLYCTPSPPKFYDPSHPPLQILWPPLLLPSHTFIPVSCESTLLITVGQNNIWTPITLKWRLMNLCSPVTPWVYKHFMGFILMTSQSVLHNI